MQTKKNNPSANKISLKIVKNNEIFVSPRSKYVRKMSDGKFITSEIIRVQKNPEKEDLPIDGFNYKNEADDGQYDINSFYIDGNSFLIIVRRLDSDSSSPRGWNKSFNSKLYFNVYLKDFVYLHKERVVIAASSKNEESYICSFRSKKEVRPISREVSAPNTSIPKIVHQTNQSYSMNTAIRNALLSIVDKNPDYEIRYYNEEARRAYIKRHIQENTSLPEWTRDEKEGILSCYDTIIPGAFKADIFRLVALYIDGGVYMDNKCVSMVSFDEFIPSDLKKRDWMTVTRDFTSENVQNSIIISTPRHPLLLKYLEFICKERISIRYKGANSHDITGPVALGRVIERLQNKGIENNKVYSIDHNADFETLLEWNTNVSQGLFFRSEKLGRNIFLFRANGYTTSPEKRSTDYGTMWKCGKIFTKK